MSNKFQQKGEISAAFGMLVLRIVSSSECQNMNLCQWNSLSLPQSHLIIWWSELREVESAEKISIEIVFLIRMMVWPLVAFLVWLFCCRKHKPNLPLPPPLSQKRNRTKSTRQSYPKRKGGRGELETSGSLHSEFLAHRKGSSFTSFLKTGCPPPVRIQLHKGVTA